MTPRRPGGRSRSSERPQGLQPSTRPRPPKGSGPLVPVAGLGADKTRNEARFRRVVRCPGDQRKTLLAFREQQLVNRYGLIDASRVLVGQGEVVARAERVGMFAPENPLALGEKGLVDRDRLLNAPRRVVSGSEVVARR